MCIFPAMLVRRQLIFNDLGKIWYSSGVFTNAFMGDSFEETAYSSRGLVNTLWMYNTINTKEASRNIASLTEAAKRDTNKFWTEPDPRSQHAQRSNTLGCLISGCVGIWGLAQVKSCWCRALPLLSATFRFWTLPWSICGVGGLQQTNTKT